MLRLLFECDWSHVFALHANENGDGITAFQMDIKVKYYERLNAIF